MAGAVVTSVLTIKPKSQLLVAFVAGAATWENRSKRSPLLSVDRLIVASRHRDKALALLHTSRL